MFTATSVTLGRRACAALALSSAGLHAAMLGHTSNVVAGGLLAVMIVACVYCARDLWLRGTLRAWCVVGLMNIAMIAVHLPMPAHHHGMHMASMGQQSTVMGLATGVAAAEVVLAIAVLYFRTRRHAQLVIGTPAR
jgi:NADH:ubiquinone oxidoreductase subunit K